MDDTNKDRKNSPSIQAAVKGNRVIVCYSATYPKVTGMFNVALGEKPLNGLGKKGKF